MMRSILALLFAAVSGLGVLGCDNAGADAARPAGAPTPRSLTAIMVDRSASRTPAEMDQDRQLLAGIIRGLDFGDGIVVMEVHHAGRGDGARRWNSEMPVPANASAPTPVDHQALARARSSAELAAGSLFTAKRPGWTDLMATLFDVSDLFRASRYQELRVVILSDMFQSTPELNMESAAIPDGAWIQTRKQHGRLPDLTGACVVVVGADRNSDRGNDVFRFWEQYFREAGSALRPANYLYTALEMRPSC
jgi:hypothetical protein